jgi:hypothetical protein
VPDDVEDNRWGSDLVADEFSAHGWAADLKRTVVRSTCISVVRRLRSQQAGPSPTVSNRSRAVPGHGKYLRLKLELANTTRLFLHLI